MSIDNNSINTFPIEKHIVLNKDSIKDFEDVKNVLEFIFNKLNLKLTGGENPTVPVGIKDIKQYVKYK